MVVSVIGWWTGKNVQVEINTILGIANKCQACGNIPAAATLIIIGGMALLQSLSQSCIRATFEQLAQSVFQRVTKTLIPGGGADFVTDQYFSTSIKSCEMKRRHAEDALCVQVHNRNQNYPTLWKKTCLALKPKLLRQNSSSSVLCKELVQQISSSFHMI